ncbi:hypothetical protein pb186bvf_001344 [Paramecium bursaria]
MNVGPFIIRTRQLLFFIPIFGYFKINYLYRYNIAKKELQKKEQDQIFQLQIQQQQHLEDPIGYLNLNGEQIEIENLYGKIKILFQADRSFYNKHIDVYKEKLSRFKINFFNILKTKDKQTEIFDQNQNILVIEDPTKFKQALFVYYQNKLIYHELNFQNTETSSRMIAAKINKEIDKEFMRKLKF